MRLGQSGINVHQYTDTVANEPVRDVRERRSKSTTRFTTSCAAEGAISFVRAPKSGTSSRLVQ